jgi:cytochrome P450
MAFARSFGSQQSENPKEVTAIHNHILLACSIGQLPFQSVSKFLIAHSPIPWIRQMTSSRQQLKEQCEECVSYRLDHPSSRKDLLHSLINTQDPETGAKLSTLDINTEAFAMLVAGSHSTSGTLGMLFYNISKNAAVLDQATQEIDTKLPNLPEGNCARAFDGLESLEYVVACVRENFRTDPVFTMTLWRYVQDPAGVRIGNTIVPPGVSPSFIVQMAYIPKNCR